MDSRLRAPLNQVDVTVASHPHYNQSNNGQLSQLSTFFCKQFVLRAQLAAEPTSKVCATTLEQLLVT